MNATVVHGKPLTMYYVLVSYEKEKAAYVLWVHLCSFTGNFKCNGDLRKLYVIIAF